MRLETLHSRPLCAADTADSSARTPHGVVHINHARLAHLRLAMRCSGAVCDARRRMWRGITAYYAACIRRLFLRQICLLAGRVNQGRLGRGEGLVKVATARLDP